MVLPVVLPVVLVLVAAALSLRHALLLSRANPGHRLPWWGKPLVRPRRSEWLLVLAVPCVVLAAHEAVEGVSPLLAGLLVLVVLAVPSAVVTVVHNRRLADT